MTHPYGVVDAKFVADVRALLSLSEGESDANQENGHPSSRVLRGAEAVACGYAGDMGHHARHPPDLVVLPLTTEEVAAVVRLCYVRRVPIVPRGAGTGLEGGCVAYRGGVVIDTCLMKRISAVDGEQLAVVGAGVLKNELNKFLEPLGLLFGLIRRRTPPSAGWPAPAAAA